MRKLRVLALMHDYMVPPEDVSGHDLASVEWKTEYDVLETLKDDLKHEVLVLPVKDELGGIRRAVKDFEPHIAFNLLEAFHEIGTFDQNLVAYLELLKLSYTGCNPRGMLLARDKALSKKLLHYHRIPVPDFFMVRVGQKVRLPRRMSFPVIVKSLTQEASIGISQASVVDDEAKLKERVQFIHDSIGTDAVVEQYIDGRELYCGIVGNDRLQVFPVWEMSFSRMPDRTHRIATEKVKWSPSYQKKVGISTDQARDLDPGVSEKIQHLSKRVFRVLQLSGYARIDIRLDEQGRMYVLEANPNPQLAYGEDFAESAERVGVKYPQLIQKILTTGLRWKADRLG